MENEKKNFFNFKYLSNNNDRKKRRIFMNKNIFFINIFLLFINIILIIKFLKFNCIKNSNINIISNLGNYSLYNLFKYPQISILILDYEYFNLNNNSIINFLNILTNQKLVDIEIFFSLSNETTNYYNIITNYSKFDDRIKIFCDFKQIILKNPFYLIEKMKGKFILIMNKIEIFDFYDLEKFYNLTKGNINNIFKFTSTNFNDIYLIKSKFLRDAFDQDLSFDNFTSIIDYIFSLPEPKLNYISIALCPDNYYSAYTYVAMISILNSKNYLTYISFYLTLVHLIGM